MGGHIDVAATLTSRVNFMGFPLVTYEYSKHSSKMPVVELGHGTDRLVTAKTAQGWAQTCLDCKLSLPMKQVVPK